MQIIDNEYKELEVLNIRLIYLFILVT